MSRKFKITRREILESISIVAIMLLLGVVISTKISEYEMDRNETYNKAVKIESSELFQYGMKTNVGNAFVYGKLKAVAPVTYSEIKGQYIYIEKIKEKYTQHTRTVTKTRTVNGKTQSYVTTETYWSWDKIGKESKSCKQIDFCGVVFDKNKFDLPYEFHIDTIKESSKIRYRYYGVKSEFTGTIFAELKNNTIPKNTVFYNDNIEETYENLTSNYGLIIFWIAWGLLIYGADVGFYYSDNKWLE